MSVQTYKPEACSDYRLRSTKLMGTVWFQTLCYHLEICEVSTHQPQLFSSCLRALHFLFVVPPFFALLSNLIICFLLAYSYQRSPGIPKSLSQTEGQIRDCQLCRQRVWQSLQNWGLSVQTTSWHRVPVRCTWVWPGSVMWCIIS